MLSPMSLYVTQISQKLNYEDNSQQKMVKMHTLFQSVSRETINIPQTELWI